MKLRNANQRTRIIISCLMVFILSIGLMSIPGEVSYAASAAEEGTEVEAVTSTEDEESTAFDDGVVNDSTDPVSNSDQEPAVTDQTEEDIDQNEYSDPDSQENTEQDINVDDDQDQNISDDAGSDSDTQYDEDPVNTNQDDENLTDPEEPAPGNSDSNEKYNGMGSITGVLEKGSCSVSFAGKNNSITIKGSINAAYTKKPYYYCFGKVYIDGVEIGDFKNTSAAVDKTFSLNGYGFDTGYHTVFLQINNKSTGNTLDLLYRTHVSYNDITARPTYNGVFEVYTKSFTYYPYNMYMANQAGKLYMEYSSNGGKTWKRTGYMQANLIELAIQQAYSIGGLKANTVYKTRIRYGTYVTYETDYKGDGKTYFFGGPVLNTTTIKTGKPNKPKIKSIKVKAVKVKYHKIRHHGQYTGVYLYTEKFYTCKFKITIKLKKKPGTRGIMVNGRYLKGNKKKYTTTFTPYPNYYTKRPPKGLKKYKVSVCSVQNKSFGGYSPSKTKKVKIRR